MKITPSSISRIIIIAIIVFPFLSKAQYYSGGQDPASLKWNQINSEHFQIIYPRGYDSTAQYVMNVMEYGRAISLKAYEVEPKKVSIILHNQTVVSNAEVAWAPRRMEIYTVTPQATYSQPWYEQLALHEYTHVLQISSMQQGLTKFLYNFFGEQITVGVFGLYVPYWFVEGDAVVNETAFSNSGRGRDPNFEAHVRAQLLEKGSYSLEKASLGSYKDFTPDRYHIGYYLVGQGRIDYNKRMWNKPMRNVTKYPYAIVPFATGITTETGLSKVDFYKQTLTNLRNEWVLQLVKSSPEELRKITENKTYVNYSNSIFISDNEIFSLKKNYHDVGAFIILDTNGIERPLFTPGYYFSDYISMGGDWICWSEYQYDPRWNYRSYVKILKFNLKTKEREIIVDKTRYFSANISPSGKKIVAVEVDEFSKHSLVIIDAQDGKLLKKIAARDNDFMAHPSWSEKEDKIVVEVLNKYGKGLAIFDIENERQQNILAYKHTHLQYPRFWKNYVIYEAAYSGVMDIYALDLATKSIYQITKSAFSVSDYSISSNGDKLILSNYTGNGKQLVMKKWTPKDWTPISEVKNNAYPLADLLSKQEDTIMNPNDIPQDEYEIKKYSKLGHAINIHSWNFIHLNADNLGINPGLSLLSQNKLSTVQARLGADYNLNTQYWRYYGNLTYLGWYPVLSVGADYGKKYIDDYQEQDTIRMFYNETNINASMYLPLLYTSGNWSFRVQPGVSFNFQKLQNNHHQLGFQYPDVKSLNYFISASGSQKSPFQNIYPTLAYSLSITYRNTPFQSELGEMLNFSVATYYPGFFRHDGWRISATYQNTFGDAEFYSNYTAPARGYTNLSYNELLTLRADYQTPLFYPDWNLSSLIYFKRIIMGVFGDYSLQADRSPTISYPNSYFWSSGVELTTDVHFLRSKFPFNIGVRGIYVDGYIKNPEAIKFEFLFGISI